MTVFVYFPHRMLQTQDWDSAAFSTTCLQSMPTAVNVSHELSLKSSQQYFTYVLLTLSRLAKTNPWPVSSAGHRNAREVLSFLSSSEDLLIIRKILVALFKFCSEFFQLSSSLEMNSKKSNEKRTSRQVIFTDINDLNTFTPCRLRSKLNRESASG